MGARRRGGKRVEVELALDDLCRQVGEFGVGVAGVGADALERSGHVDVRAFRHHALGLFDDDAAVERVLELLIAQLRQCGGHCLQDGDAGEIGQCPCELDVALGEWAGVRSEQVEGTDDVAAEPERHCIHRVVSGPDGVRRESWPTFERRPEAGFDDGVTGRERFQAGTLVVLELEEFEELAEASWDEALDLVNAKLAGLPPVTIINAQIDPLREDGALLEAALKKAGVTVTRTVYSGVTHEFFGMAAAVKKAADAQAQGGKALRDALQSKPASKP